MDDVLIAAVDPSVLRAVTRAFVSQGSLARATLLEHVGQSSAVHAWAFVAAATSRPLSLGSEDPESGQEPLHCKGI